MASSGLASESPFRFLLPNMRPSSVVSSTPLLYITARARKIKSHTPLISLLVMSPPAPMASVARTVSGPVTTIRMDFAQWMATSDMVGICLPMGDPGPNSHTNEQGRNPNQWGMICFLRLASFWIPQGLTIEAGPQGWHDWAKPRKFIVSLLSEPVVALEK